MPACTMSTAALRASALTSEGRASASRPAPSSSPVGDRLRLEPRRRAVLQLAEHPTQLDRQGDVECAADEGECATSARSATAPSPGSTNITTPNPASTMPLSAISRLRGPLIGSANAATISVTPSAIAQIAIVEEPGGREVGPHEHGHAEAEPDERVQRQPDAVLRRCARQAYAATPRRTRSRSRTRPRL